MRLYERIKAALAAEVVGINDYEQVKAERDSLKAEMQELEAWVDTLQVQAKEADAQAAEAGQQVQAAQAQAQAVQAQANATVAAIADAGLPVESIQAVAPPTREALLNQAANLKTVAERKAFFETHKATLASE